MYQSSKYHLENDCDRCIYLTYIQRNIRNPKSKVVLVIGSTGKATFTASPVLCRINYYSLVGK